MDTRKLNNNPLLYTSNRNTRPPNNKNDNHYTTLTYLKNTSERITKVIKTYNPNINIAYKNNNTLQNNFTKLKDRIPLLKKSNVVYKIPCLGNGEPGSQCNLNYVGQTKQHLGKRLANHRNDLRKSCDPSLPKTALMNHFHSLDHYPNFNAVSILDTQTHYRKRLTTEALHIYTQNTYNIKRDTDDLSPIFCAVINSNTKMIKIKQSITNTNKHYNTHNTSTHRTTDYCITNI